MREKTIAKLRESIVKDAKHEIRSQLRAKIVNHKLTKYKANLKRRYKRQASRVKLSVKQEAS